MPLRQSVVRFRWLPLVLIPVTVAACGDAGGVDVDNPLTDPMSGPHAGNPNPEANCSIGQSLSGVTWHWPLASLQM